MIYSVSTGARRQSFKLSYTNGIHSYLFLQLKDQDWKIIVLNGKNISTSTLVNTPEIINC